MKYLKNYKIFESAQDSIDYIQDIFSDLRDNYFEIEIRLAKDFSDLYHRVIADHLKAHYLNTGKILPTEIIEIMIKKYPENPIFHYSEIESEIKSAVDYMLSDGWLYVLDPVFEGSSGIGYHIDDTFFLKHMEVKKLTGFSIRFYR
jgi:hypothetical protein